MGTEVLTPRDCLSGNSGARFYAGAAFSSPRTTQNRRKNTAASRPVQPVQTRRTPSPKTKKIGRKASPPPSGNAPLAEGFRLLKRGEAFSPAEKPADRTSPEPVTPIQTKPRRYGSDPGLSGEKNSILGRFKAETVPATPAEAKSVLFVPDPVVSVAQPSPIKPERHLVTPPPKAAAGRLRSGAIYAGPGYTAASPEPSSLPVPSFLQKSSSTGSSDDEASKALRCLLKLNIL